MECSREEVGKEVISTSNQREATRFFGSLFHLVKGGDKKMKIFIRTNGKTGYAYNENGRNFVFSGCYRFAKIPAKIFPLEVLKKLLKENYPDSVLVEE